MIRNGNEALEPETKPESEGIHLHHNDMSNEVF